VDDSLKNHCCRQQKLEIFGAQTIAEEILSLTGDVDINK